MLMTKKIYCGSCVKTVHVALTSDSEHVLKAELVRFQPCESSPRALFKCNGGEILMRWQRVVGRGGTYVCGDMRGCCHSSVYYIVLRIVLVQ